MTRLLEYDHHEQREGALAQRFGVRQSALQQTVQAAAAFAASAPADAAPSPWRPAGARNVTGRVRCLAQHPRNSAVLYAGTGQGGVFRSDDAGRTWQAIGGAADVFPVGALGLAPSNPSVLYIGSGEPSLILDGASATAREVCPTGRGFFRYDAATGSLTSEVGALASGAAAGANSYAAIAIHPQNADRCWVASHTGLWRREPAGPRFRREPIPGPTPPVAPALGANVCDVLLVEQQPSGYRLFAAVAGVGVFRGTIQTSGEVQWEPRLEGGLPAAASSPSFDRVRLAACPSFPNHVYAVFGNATNQEVLGVFHSSDGGTRWLACAVPPDLGREAWSHLCIAVHPTNPRLLLVGNVRMARSEDAGATWQVVIDDRAELDPAQHGGQQAAIFDSAEPDRVWVAHDGGIVATRDVSRVTAGGSAGWHRRSLGLCASQFHFITAHPDYPFMLGGGTAGCGTYLTFGGPSWLPIGDADGGQLAFELKNPRQFSAPHRGERASGLANLMQARVVAGSVVPAARDQYPALLRGALADQSADPGDVFAAQISEPAGIPSNVGGLFVPRVVHHPSEPGRLLAGGTGDAAFSADGGLDYTACGANAHVEAADVTALAYGPGTSAAQSDWWLGTSNGSVVRGDGGTISKTWSDVTPPAPAPGLAGFVISGIAVHPSSARYVAVATGGKPTESGASTQGRVFLTTDRGSSWLDITGLIVAFDLGGAGPGPLAGPLHALPPCPITSLAFDPSAPTGSAQVLYVGTLAGVYVIRNLPPLPTDGAPTPSAPAPFNPDWRAFNGTAAVPLPLGIVSDLELSVLPARTGAPADSPESATRVRLHAALTGRGLFVCDASPTRPAGIGVGGPPRRLFLRQHAVEDGLAYPRATPGVLNTAPASPSYDRPELGGDPRLATALAFDDFSAFDLRIDNEPFQLEAGLGGIDGVLFDEALRTKDLVPGRSNAIYVQVHNAGWDRFAQPVDVHLYFAPGVASTGPDAPPLPDLHDNFWQNFAAEPELPAPATAPAGGAARWQRAGSKQTIAGGRLAAGTPVVVRFDWVPPLELADAPVALLALCTSADDVLTSAGRSTSLSALVREERRAAFRRVPCGRFVPDVYVRDDLEDSGRPGGGAFAGRSPDIIVVQTAVSPAAAFTDLADPHASDRIREGHSHLIYVRVHNRGDVEVQATVEVSWVKPNVAIAAPDSHAPAFDATKWTRIGSDTVTVPPKSWTFAQVTWPSADVPARDATAGAFNAIGFVALVSSSRGVGDDPPASSTVTDAPSFWSFFGRTLAGNNAAFRAVRYEPPFSFDPPGSVDDLGGPGDALYELWNDEISRRFNSEISNLNTRTLPAGSTSQLYNPRLTPTRAPSATLSITWSGFPQKFLRQHRDSRRDAWAAAEVFQNGVARTHDEYLEWFAHKNSAGLIDRIDFTAEALDFWLFLAKHAPDKVLQLYRRYINPPVGDGDLRTHLFPNGHRPALDSGGYDHLNRWNTQDGAMHLIQPNNTLGAEINLVAQTTTLFRDGAVPVTDPLQLSRRQIGTEWRSSDPRIGFDINSLARRNSPLLGSATERGGFAITLQNPVGLLIDNLNDQGFAKPDGSPAGNYWRVLRGFAGGIVRATYRVPPTEGFVVGEMKIGGQRIEYGGQVAEHVTMKVVGLVCRELDFNNPPRDTGAAPPPTFGLLDPSTVASLTRLA